MALLGKAIALFVLTAPVALVAQDAPAETGDTAQAAPDTKEDKKVCKRLKVTGSRMRQRICRLQSQWDAAEAGNVDDELRTKGDSTDMGEWSPFSGATSSVLGVGGKRPD